MITLLQNAVVYDKIMDTIEAMPQKKRSAEFEAC